MPNAAERAKLARRLERLGRMERSITRANTSLGELASRRSQVTEVRIREAMVRRASPAPGEDYSDRRIPPRHLRPPATRLISANGVALRLLLTALMEAQTSGARAGARPENRLPLSGTRDSPGWIDLLASPAQHSRAGNGVSIAVKDKKLRQLNDTLKRLADAELVSLPNAHAGAGKRTGFELLDEGGQRAYGDNDRYLLPKSSRKDVFTIPITFFTQGWVHCLEDTELAMLLMLSAEGAQDSLVKIDGEERLRYYCVGRDAYEAHIMLNRLGLINVWPDLGRRPDGTVENYQTEGAQLHSFKLLPETFANPAFDAVTEAIRGALEQATVVQSGS